MKKVKSFNDFLNENFNVNKVQFLYKRILNSLGVKLYYASKYETAMVALLPVVDNFITAEGYIFDKTNSNIVLIMLYATAILTHESTDKINKIHEIIKKNNITDIEVQYLINGLNNLRYIFSLVAKERKVESFYDMLKETDFLIPFLYVINNMILNDRLNINMFTGKFDVIKNYLGQKGFDLLIHNIMNKMNVALGSANRIQNIENLKPLLMNQEFKSPMYKTGKLDLKDNVTESLLDKLKGPSKEEVWSSLGYDRTFDTPEEFFLDIIDGIKIKPQTKYPDSIFWEKNGKVIFEQDFKKNQLYVDYKSIWMIFEKIFGLQYSETELFIKNMVEEYLNWRGLTPFTFLYTTIGEVE